MRKRDRKGEREKEEERKNVRERGKHIRIMMADGVKA
jgi:hypothetical protein